MRAAWPTENLLLGLLAQKPLHGYGLARLVREDDVLRSIWHLKRSEVYFLLGKLAAQGHIAEVTDKDGDQARPVQQGGPPRQVYQVTAAGRDALNEWLSQPVRSPRQLRAEFLAKLYLAWRCSLAPAGALLERQRDVLHEWGERLRSDMPSDPFLVLVHELRLAQVEAASRTLESVQDALGSSV